MEKEVREASSASQPLGMTFTRRSRNKDVSHLFRRTFDSWFHFWQSCALEGLWTFVENQ